jgi:dienelactone hydrolase
MRLFLAVPCSPPAAWPTPRSRLRRFPTRAPTARLIGYYAYDDAIKGKRPGVVVVHEWWGLNDYAKRRARDLAELGYSALAIDMYGEGKNTEHPKDAMAFMQAAKDAAASSNVSRPG